MLKHANIPLQPVPAHLHIHAHKEMIRVVLTYLTQQCSHHLAGAEVLKKANTTVAASLLAMLVHQAPGVRVQECGQGSSYHARIQLILPHGRQIIFVLFGLQGFNSQQSTLKLVLTFMLTHHLASQHWTVLGS